MLLDIRKISHQRQNKKNNCVSTCLSIVTGLEEDFVAGELSKDGYCAPYSIESAVRFLCRNGVHCEKVGGSMNQGMMNERIYFVTCPSSVSPKSAHLIVLCVIQNSFLIIDPADDLESEKIYSDIDFSKGNIPCFDYYLLTDCNLE